MLSSATEAIMFLSLGFQLKSVTLAVCPPCMNSISAGPSFKSSSLRSAPIQVISQTITLLSEEPDAKRFS